MDKGRSKRTRRVFFGKEQAQDTELWSEEDFAWWTKGRKGKKGWSKSNDGFPKGSYRPYQSYKGAGKDFNQNKGKRNDQKGKSDESLYPQPGRSASEAPDEVGYGMPGNRMTDLPASGLTILVFQLLGRLARELILHGRWHPL